MWTRANPEDDQPPYTVVTSNGPIGTATAKSKALEVDRDVGEE
jgi:hypothetical protein